MHLLSHPGLEAEDPALLPLVKQRLEDVAPPLMDGHPAAMRAEPYASAARTDN